VFGGALLGVLFRTMLPEEHLSSDTKDVVKLGIALIATMAALVLGLLIASAKSTYDTRRNQLLQVSTDIILLDRILANYGAETRTALSM
jgi:fluoride ion exporter CrcB/FEX